MKTKIFKNLMLVALATLTLGFFTGTISVLTDGTIYSGTGITIEPELVTKKVGSKTETTIVLNIENKVGSNTESYVSTIDANEELPATVELKKLCDNKCDDGELYLEVADEELIEGEILGVEFSAGAEE